MDSAIIVLNVNIQYKCEKSIFEEYVDICLGVKNEKSTKKEILLWQKPKTMNNISLATNVYNTGLLYLHIVIYVTLIE